MAFCSVLVLRVALFVVLCCVRMLLCYKYKMLCRVQKMLCSAHNMLCCVWCGVVYGVLCGVVWVYNVLACAVVWCWVYMMWCGVVYGILSSVVWCAEKFAVLSCVLCRVYMCHGQKSLYWGWSSHL